jgi:hypothetical protein
MPERWRRRLDALGWLDPDPDALRARLDRPRRPDPGPTPARRIAAGAVAVGVAMASFAILLTTEGGPEDRAGDPSISPGASPSGGANALDPARICDVPAYDPDVALIGDRYDSNLHASPGPLEVPLDLLRASGEPGDEIDGPADDDLRRFLSSPDAANAPADGWRAIVESDEEVIFAAPNVDGDADWWIVRFVAGGDRWRFEHVQLADQRPTPAQLGRGLRLTWGETTVVDDGVWGSTLELANDRGTSWTSEADAYELWGIGHVFDPATGVEVGHAARTVGRWGVQTRLGPGETARLPLSLGGALSALQSGNEYAVVACVPELGLASEVGALRVAEHPMASARVLTYAFEGVAMQALGGGRLVVHNGCLAVESSPGQRRTYVVWPDGTSLVLRDGERPVLIDAVGRELARLGDDVTIGGGYVGLEHLEDGTVDPIPDACRRGGEGYFITSGLAESG